MPIIYNITTERQFKRLVSKADTIHVLNFWATKAEPCKQMNEVFRVLADRFPSLTYIQIEAEEFPAISQSMSVESVPSFLIVKDNQVLNSVEGAKAAELSNLVAKYNNEQGSNQQTISDNELEFRLRDLIQTDRIMVFMKGSPSKPRCGFSRQVVELLTELQVKYSSFDILTDDQVRQGLKTLSDWPTYPQIYVKGELVGGLDLLKEMIASGEFQDMV
ncbi:glutaredoxin [Mucor ambiguus]|uniref:Glutaredoxin n=1 Tax=Mucor ambiguus TaxID=91626 RepID=A0A0C9M976_9FUNG|nr:glutaredoxin [Mucor ambiguus]